MTLCTAKHQLNGLISCITQAGYSALHRACLQGHAEIAEMLLASGALLDVQNWQQARPIHHVYLCCYCTVYTYILLLCSLYIFSPCYVSRLCVVLIVSDFCSGWIHRFAPSMQTRTCWNSRTSDTLWGNLGHLESGSCLLTTTILRCNFFVIRIHVCYVVHRIVVHHWIGLVIIIVWR